MPVAFLLVCSSCAAPIPPAPPPLATVTAKRVARPPALINANGKPELINIDDGHFLEVTVTNTSKKTLSLTHEVGFRDNLVYVKVSDEKGKEVSNPIYRFVYRSLFFDQTTFELQPGDSFSTSAHLLASLLREKKFSGKYTARAVFLLGELKVESPETFELEFGK